ncbi:MAG: hypothetical protein M3271_04695 [Actinomycetota bacterium]|nr:hypothetical protein [Actinomycetota bacterium]
MLGVVALAAGVLSVAPTASAGHGTVAIQVGASLPGSPGESMRFLGPKSITVHQGDRISFDFHGFHTATLLPAGVGADEWLEDNAEGTGPYSFIARDPDDGPNAYKDNFGFIVTPSDPSCGGSGERPCDYTGGEVVNSGAPQGPDESLFTATVNARPGSSFWVVCLIHHRMRLRVKVSTDPTEATPQTEINQARDAQIAQDTDLARAAHAKYNVRRSSHRTESGRRVWDAWAGVDIGHVALLAFYPKRLVVGEGETVRWRFDHLMYEDHTVSMPVPAVFGINFDRPMCDPDGDAGTQEDTPAEEHEEGPPTCPEGSELEIDIEDEFWSGVGNGALTGRNDVEHSGIRGAQAADISPPAAGTGPFDVRFTDPTGKNPVEFICFIHGNMVGNVHVRR